MARRAGRAAPERRGTSPEAAFGAVLREHRRAKGLSQEELAARSGYQRMYIGQLERAEKSPSLRTIFNVAAALGVSPAKIILVVERMIAQ
jgi:transcriptional regulator with XRE-family HTH domain